MEAITLNRVIYRLYRGIIIRDLAWLARLRPLWGRSRPPRKRTGAKRAGEERVCLLDFVGRVWGLPESKVKGAIGFFKDT